MVGNGASNVIGMKYCLWFLKMKPNNMLESGCDLSLILFESVSEDLPY